MRHLRIVSSRRPYGGNIIAKMADLEAMLNLKMINIAHTTKPLAIDVNYDFVVVLAQS